MSEAVLDASAVLAVLKAEPGAQFAEEAFPAHISSVNLSEVVAKLSDGGMTEPTIRDALQSLPLQVVTFDEEQAYDTGLLRPATRNLGLSLGDRACVGLARRLGAPVLTADQRWSRLSVGVDVTVTR